MTFAPAIGWLAYVAGYLVLVTWFKWIDVYHAHFSTAGILVAVHNLFRVLFIVYLFWMAHAVGALALRAFGRTSDNGIGALEGLALGFFTGAGLWHVVLFPLGYLDLYSVPVAIALTVPAVALSYRNICETLAYTRQQLVQRRPARAVVIWAAIVVLFGAALLLVKGLYPGGGHDYYTHYFHFYRTVLETGGVWPNEVWYHYYYSKGAGLFFLGMLLTDPLAPQLVTFCMMAAAALVLFLFCRQAAPETAWPFAAVAIFLFVYIYTPIWGQFEKLHEINTAFVIAILWMAAKALESRNTRAGLTWFAGAASAIVAAVIVNITVAVFLGAVFGLVMLWHLIRRARRQSLIGLGLATITGVTLVAILTINFITTGLVNDQGILFLWQFADIEKLDRIGFLPLIIKQHWGMAGMAAETLRLVRVPNFLIESARLDLLYPLVLGGFLTATLGAIATRRSGRQHAATPVPQHAALLLAATIVFVCTALALGRAQPSSFFRYASFMVPIMIAAGIVLWSRPITGAPDWLARLVRNPRTPPVVFAITILTTLVAMHQRERLFDQVLPRAAQFAVGALSIDAAYTRQTGWPFKPWGAIYPGARGASAVAGPNTPIRSLHTESYCMLPDCRVESADSFGIGSDWDVVMFGTPEEARRALQASGRNYFLFSRELPLQDYLPRSPLFAPDTIARYLGIRWTDGTTALLSWIGPDTAPLDAAWLADYRRAVASSGFVRNFPYEQMREIMTRLNESPRPRKPFPIVWRRD